MGPVNLLVTKSLRTQPFCVHVDKVKQDVHMDDELELDNPLLASEAPSEPPPACRLDDSSIETHTVSENASETFEPLGSELEVSETDVSELEVSQHQFSENSRKLHPKPPDGDKIASQEKKWLQK
jgi:hypothetical protein